MFLSFVVVGFLPQHPALAARAQVGFLPQHPALAARAQVAPQRHRVVRAYTPTNPETHCTVVFLRHGQSTWNSESLFTGWADVELTTLGKNEAANAATQMWRAGIKIDVAYTSRLKRAQQTLDMVLRITGQEDVPCHANWRLNERMYGALTGLNKKETARKYGAEQVKVWRRSYDTPPPPVDESSEHFPGNDNEYAHIPDALIPRSECLKDTVERTLPYWDEAIVPALKRGKTVLVAAHGNSIRGLLKVLDGVSDDAISGIEIPTAVPLVYHLDKKMRAIRHPRAVPPLTGYFLADPEELKRAQAAVAAQSVVEKSKGVDIGRPSAEVTDWIDEAGGEVQFACIGSGCLMLARDEMRAAFEAFDANADGFVDVAELHAMVRQLSEGADAESPIASAAEVDALFARVDRDGDGRIDFLEFVQAVTADK